MTTAMRQVNELAKDLLTLGIYTGGGLIIFFTLLRIVRRVPGAVGNVANTVGAAATFPGSNL